MFDKATFVVDREQIVLQETFFFCARALLQARLRVGATNIAPASAPVRAGVRGVKELRLPKFPGCAASLRIYL